MNFTYKVEIDTTGSNFGTTFSGTDVTSYALAGDFGSVSITWGRQDQWAQVTPTSVTGTFNNSDGRFTPGLSSGAYYPRIRRNLRRRVTITAAATDVHLSEDYATSIEVVPSKTRPTSTVVTGSDILARFGGAPSSDSNQVIVGTALRSFLAEEMILDSPSSLFMFQEPEGSTSFADVTNNLAPATVVNSSFGPGVVDAGQSPTNIVSDADLWFGGNMVQITNQSYGINVHPGSWIAGNLPSVGSSYTFEIWVQMPSTVPAATQSVIVEFALNTDFQITTAGHVQIASGVATAGSLCDGGIHQIVGVVSGATITLYVDGASVASGSSSGFNPGSTFAIGMVTSTSVNSFSGGVAYFGVFPTALSGSRILAHYNAGVTGFAGESTDTRITRLLSYRPNTGSVVDTGLSTMGQQNIQGRSLADCLLEVGQVEAGAVFVDGQGRVNFRSRSRLVSPTPVLTLDCSAGNVDFGSNFREDIQNVLNDVTVTATGDAAQRYVNAGSVAVDGEFSTSVELPLNSNTTALALATYMVTNGVAQQITASPLIVNLLQASASLVKSVCQLQPLDCIQVTNIPALYGPPSSTMSFIVEGGQLDLAMDIATASLTVVPVPTGSF